MARFRSSRIDRTLWSNCGNARPRHCVGLLASPALHDRRNASIWDRFSAFCSDVDGVVDGYHIGCDARARKCNSGDAIPRICEHLCIYDVGARCAATRAGAVARSSWYRGLADPIRIEL